MNDWFANYLENRQHSVNIENHKSTMLNVRCGVPKGSILGPLYLIYVNDIHISCSANILSFADVFGLM